MLTPPPATPLQGDSSPTRLSQAHTRESVGQTVPAGLPAAHDEVSQCWRALREEDVVADTTPSSALDPLVLEAADPVISHGVTQSRDRSMGRSTASHAGSLPMVPPSGRPPDCNDRPLGGATNDNACLAPSLLHLDRASAASTGPNLTVTPTSPPSAPAEAPTSAPTAAPTSAHTPTSAPTAPSPPRVSSEVGASQTWGVGPSRSQVLGSLAPAPIEAGSVVTEKTSSEGQKENEAVRITPGDPVVSLTELEASLVSTVPALGDKELAASYLKSIVPTDKAAPGEGSGARRAGASLRGEHRCWLVRATAAVGCSGARRVGASPREASIGGSWRR